MELASLTSDTPQRERRVATASSFSRWQIGLLTVLALCLRLFALIATIDVPGDGPTRASAAYEWAQSPHLVAFGFWPPGFLYIGGLATILFPYPAYTTRVLNVVLGTATIPVAFAVAAPIYGASIALATATLLAVWPLHITLSATGLSEPSTLFALLMGVWLLLHSTHRHPPSNVLTLGAAAALSIASMTRYEVWPLLPAFPLYYWVKTHRGISSLAIAAMLSAFPITWTLGNYVATGDPLLGLTAAMAEPTGAGSPQGAAWAAMQTLTTTIVATLGPLFPVAVLLGCAAETAAARRGTVQAERLLWFGLAAALDVMLVALAAARGHSLWNRYFLLPLAVSIPLALVPAARMSRAATTRGLWLRLILFLLLTVGLGRAAVTYDPRTFHSPTWLTTDKPTEIQRLATWLAGSPWRADAVLLTRMDWHSTYLALYYPPISGKQFIISEWTNDALLRLWISLSQPGLFVTQRMDTAYIASFERVTGRVITETAPVYVDGDILAFPLTASSEGASPDSRPSARAP